MNGLWFLLVAVIAVIAGGGLLGSLVVGTLGAVFLLVGLRVLMRA